ncbi:TIGR00366 family protein [Marinobacter sp. M3C]|jgi:short-chain fatty acids transporter|uniref:short-chain fatty acid transporter n=1 Tax=Marinobacter sp. M3C TaxID=2917715 RepID=UPI00200C2ABA|nr:TIGR00366 family protein [Marinobacter sp. M3C]UQG60881.1 TIGR00366 family protein [Marinobacter sp. M3C]
MLQAAGAFSARLSRQYIPNPFIFAIILTVIVYALGVLLTPSGPFEMVQYWYGGFWNLLSFGMQMVVILLFGYVLAASPPARKIIAVAAKLPKNAGQAIMLVTVLAIVFGFVSWGLGLIVGAISAREICTQAKLRGIKVHYPLAAAAGFTGLIIFNAGFSASAPLLVNTKGHFLESTIGLIPVSETILSPFNLITFAAFLIIIPLVYRAMHPKVEDTDEVPDFDNAPAKKIKNGQATAEEGEAVAINALMKDKASAQQHATPEETVAEKLENAPALTWIIVLAGLSFVVHHFITKGFDLNLNIVNFILLIVGMVAYKTPMAYVKAIDEGIRACGQVVLQFPFYAGIMGMMAASGLVSIFADWMVAMSNVYTLPLTSLLSAAVVNLAVPSAGGQWAVQGPMLVEAAQKLGSDLGVIIMSFSYGDQLTNGIQPMWMLPLLGITSLKAREILGYTAVMMLVAFVIFAFGVCILPLLF